MILQLDSINRWAGDGTTLSWNFTFSGGYIQAGHIKCYVQDAAGVRSSPSFTLTGPFTLQLAQPVPVGSELTIYRDTPQNLPLAEFSDGTAITEASLNLMARQAVFLAAEFADATTAVADGNLINAMDDIEAVLNGWASGVLEERLVDWKADLDTELGVWKTETEADLQVSVMDLLPTPVANRLIGWNSAGSELVNLDPAAIVTDNSAAVALASVQRRATLADLRASDSAAVSAIQTLGYWAAGDGGGGLYRKDIADTTSADTGLAVIVAADGVRWKLVHDGRVSVLQAGARGYGPNDDHAAFQACINYCVGPQYAVVIPAPPEAYLIKNYLLIYNGTKIEGESSGQFVQGYSQIPKFSHIHFVPTSSGTDLFVPLNFGNTDPFIEHISVSGLYCSAGAGARYCFNNTGVIYSTFRDLGIMDFVSGFSIQVSINNRYENVLIKGSTAAPAIYSSSSDVATTDVWDQCTFFSAPQGPYLQGVVGIRFLNCIWEQLDNYGLHLARDCHSVEVVGGYCEDVPYANNPNGSMFRVGHDIGTGLPVDVALHVMGGVWSGRNAGTVGAFLDCDHTNGVHLTGVTHNRFTTIIKTTANTRDNSIVPMGTNGFGFTTFADNLNKLSGIYPSGVLNSGSNAQHLRVPVIRTRIIYAADGLGSEVALDGGAIVLGTGAASAVYPAGDAAVDLGTASHRWKSVSAGKARVSEAADAGAAGTLTMGAGTSVTVGGAGGAAALPDTPLGYMIWYVGGTPVKVPFYTQ